MRFFSFFLIDRSNRDMSRRGGVGDTSTLVVPAYSVISMLTIYREMEMEMEMETLQKLFCLLGLGSYKADTYSPDKFPI